MDLGFVSTGSSPIDAKESRDPSASRAPISSSDRRIKANPRYVVHPCLRHLLTVPISRPRLRPPWNTEFGFVAGLKKLDEYLISRSYISGKDCCYDQSLFTLYGDSILEDLVITLADRVATPEKKERGRNMSNLGQKSPDRASFVNLLSQYLKERRNLGDFSAGITSKHDSKAGQQARTLNLLSHVANSSEISRPNLVASTTNVKSSDFFSGSVGASGSREDTVNNTDLRKPVAGETKNAQLTIFFNGQVVVYNDFPADKVKEIMALANHASSTACGSVNISDPAMEKPSSNVDKIDTTNTNILNLNIASATLNNPAQDPSVEQRHYGASDLRIARRNSLHKFFEKRKDRAAARAPYQLNNNRVSPPPPKPDENKPSCEEGQSSKGTPRDIDLNL